MVKKSGTTKNFVKYDGEKGYLYVRHEALPQPVPEEMTVTLNPA